MAKAVSWGLSKEESARRIELTGEVDDAWKALEDAVSEFNEKLAALKEPVQEALTKYNEAVVEAARFCEGIANQADEDISGMSERWQESEKGRNVIAWKDEFENASLPEIEIDFPEELSSPDAEALGTLEELNEEPAE